MYQINNPLEGCIVFATKAHPKLMNGARVGLCEKVLKGAILVLDGEKEYVVCTVYDGPRFHDFWMDGEAPIKPTSSLLSDVIKADYHDSVEEFGEINKFNIQSVGQWSKGGWIIYEGTIYSPNRRHNRWVCKQLVGEFPTTLEDLIAINYSDNQRLFCKQNKISLQSVQSWLREGWLIHDGVIYRPQRSLLCPRG